MNSSYEQKHPLYAASFTKRRKAMDLYEGGERIEGNRAYLTRHTYESDKQYDIRASRATYRNFAAPIVDVFASFVNEGRPERILPDALRPIEADADRYGMTADAFFADVTRLAAAGGARFVIVDMEQKKGETVAEDRASGRRMVPYFTSISPDDVWDWGMDAKGLAWAVIHSEEMEHPAAFAAPLRYETLTVWTRDSWTRYRRPMKDKENTEYALTENGERRHGLGAVPLVPFLFEPTSPMTGLPATDDVLSLILRIYRRDSELDKMLFDRAVPLLNVGGVNQKHWDTFVVASSNALMSTEPGGITAQYVEPVRHRVSGAGRSPCPRRGQRAGNLPSYGPSAIRRGRVRRVKAIDKTQLDTQLASFARRSGSAQGTLCWKLAARWLGAKEDGIKAKYNESYDVCEATVKIKGRRP
ncbi:hypothetical protein [Bilophila wadsworthia]|uniref:hypothetical protein n=1 Tax=Bilophila wadsworthia TaxID=35833 RepID=UPI00242B2E80|nr:hypothetical protein [Bilophila wadsworthia]